MRVALAHDYLLVLRGAERTFAAMAECWPGAPISTLLADGEVVKEAFAGHSVRTSRLQRLPVGQSRFRALLPLFPAAAGRLDPAPADLLVSSSSAFAHGVPAPPGAVHVCYCHSPFRYVWHERERAAAEFPRPLRPAGRALLERVRRWDLAAARGVDHYIANSAITQQRIREFWGRDSVVVHPPVETDRFAPGEPEDFFLVVCEVVRHKRVEEAIRAARTAGARVKVVGEGPDLERLRALYGDHADFLGRIDDAGLAALYPRARALVVPNVEEFGIAAVEAQAAGRPVIAPDAGGTAETVVDGTTGVLVGADDERGIAEAMRHVDFHAFDAAAISEHAARFGKREFQRRLIAEIDLVTGPGDTK